MSNQLNMDHLSSFGKTALALDTDFSELERLSGQIDRLDFTSDSGMERAHELLAHFGQVGDRISSQIQGFAVTLNEARSRAENAAKLVAERAMAIQERHTANLKMMERFQALNERVRIVTQTTGQLKKPVGSSLTDEQKAEMRQHLTQLDTELAPLIDEASAMREEARSAGMRTLERNADSMSQTLQAARRKIASV